MPSRGPVVLEQSARFTTERPDGVPRGHAAGRPATIQRDIDMKSILSTSTLAILALAGFARNADAVTLPTAGSLANAGLACYVDTYAYDQLVRDYCGAVWRPSTGHQSTVAHFEVVGLDPGYPYTFTWSRPGCGNRSYCDPMISATPEQTITLTVTVRNQLGQTKKVTATAEYIDGWH